MTTEPQAQQNPVVEQLRAQNAELAAQLDHSRMANRGWREQMQEVQVTLSRTQQALGQANARALELERELNGIKNAATMDSVDAPEEPSDEV